jgi:hypothetical protein
MVHETPPDLTDDRRIENEPWIGSLADDDASWSKKSLAELEQDADQVLEDIRNIGSNVKHSAAKEAGDSSNRYDFGALPAQEFLAFDAATNAENAPRSEMVGVTLSPTLVAEKSPIVPMSAGDIDDESMRGELERLDAVANAIRLSLDGKQFEQLQESTTFPLLAQATAESDFLVPSNSSSERNTEQVVVDDSSMRSTVVDSVAFKHSDQKNKVAHWIMALCMAFLLIAILWLWTIYTMIIVSQCAVLTDHGVLRWPTCARRME